MSPNIRLCINDSSIKIKNKKENGSCTEEFQIIYVVVTPEGGGYDLLPKNSTEGGKKVTLL